MLIVTYSLFDMVFPQSKYFFYKINTIILKVDIQPKMRESRSSRVSPVLRNTKLATILRDRTAVALLNHNHNRIRNRNRNGIDRNNYKNIMLFLPQQ